jgi:hypothetical protein
VTRKTTEQRWPVGDDATAGRVRQPHDLGHRGQRDRPVRGRGSARREDLIRARHLHLHLARAKPSALLAEFRTYYGPTINAHQAAAANGREADLNAELDTLFNEQNTSSNDATSIPATFLRVTVEV